MEELKERVCVKFQRGGSAGSRQLASLVRLRDQLELVDDEDAPARATGRGSKTAPRRYTLGVRRPSCVVVALRPAA